MEPEKKPLATYKERTLFRTQTVNLFFDRIEATGSADWSAEWEWCYELRHLSDQFGRGRVRNKLFSVGFYSLGLWLVLLVVLLQIPQVDLLSSSWGLFYAMPLFSLTLIFVSLKKYRYVTVRSTNGTPVFQILDGGQGDKFDRFVARLQELIQEQRSSLGVPGEASKEEEGQPN